MDKAWFIKRLDTLRAERKWSKCKLNDEVGLSAGMIYQWYNTERVPTIQNIEAICEACNITLAEFFSQDERGCSEARHNMLVREIECLLDGQVEFILKVIDNMKCLIAERN